jgi:hypothetical protein
MPRDKGKKPDEQEDGDEGEGDALPWKDHGDTEESDDKPVPWDAIDESDEGLEDLLDDDAERIQEILDKASSVPCPSCGQELQGRKTNGGELEVRCTNCSYHCAV